MRQHTQVSRSASLRAWFARSGQAVALAEQREAERLLRALLSAQRARQGWRLFRLSVRLAFLSSGGVQQRVRALWFLWGRSQWRVSPPEFLALVRSGAVRVPRWLPRRQR